MLAKPPGAAVPLASNTSRADGSSGVNRLRARAQLYRRLAETLYDPKIVSVVLTCASECEAQAGAFSGNQPNSTEKDQG